MAVSRMSEVMQRWRNAELLCEETRLPDGHLLERFVTRRDEAALAALVRRHGPMVWGVCRRMLPSHHDAEDAFQATFLVLVRKAATIAPRALVANWLYGVAHQTAQKTRARSATRRARERQVTVMPDVATPDHEHGADLQPLLDQALHRLPDKYRVPIVLCDLEGKTRKEAARQLGLPEGTVASRLARGRAKLAKRLARLGLAISGQTLAFTIAQQAASAPLPASILSSTIQAARLLATGQAATAGVISTEVVALTEGVLKAMLLTKLKTALALVLAVAVVSAGVAGLVYHVQADEPALQNQERAAKTEQPQAAADHQQLAKELKQMRAEIERLRVEVERLRADKAGKAIGEPAKPTDEGKVSEAKLVIKVYAVADLMIGLEPEDPVQWLADVITNVLEPRSWSTAGGAGVMEYFHPGRALIVSNTADVQERLQGLLKSLRDAKKEQEKLLEPPGA